MSPRNKLYNPKFLIREEDLCFMYWPEAVLKEVYQSIVCKHLMVTRPENIPKKISVESAFFNFFLFCVS